MNMSDSADTIVSIRNVCAVWRQEEQMAGHGGLVVRFTGGGSTHLLEYENPEELDADYESIRSTMIEMDHGVVRRPVTGYR